MAEPVAATSGATPAPSVPVESFDLDAHRAARANPKPAEAKPVEDATPDPDVEADPELAKEIDEIEAPKPEETPQEKAARTKRNKEKASKSSRTRYRNQRDEARTQLAEREREIEEWRTGKRTHQPAPAAETKPAATDDDPKPTLKDFPLEKFKDEDDPYDARAAALAEAVGRWGARDENRKRDATAQDTRRREQADQDARDTLTAHETREKDAKTRIADYDAVVSAAAFDKTPATPHLLDLVFRSDVSADVVYHLAKHPETTRRLLQSRNRDELILGFAEVQADIKAALKSHAKTPAPHKVTSAPEPVQPVTASAGTGAILRNPMTDSGTSIDIDEIRAHRQRRAG